MAFSTAVVKLIPFSNNAAEKIKLCTPFIISGKKCGFLIPNVLKEVQKHPNVFKLQYGEKDDIEAVTFHKNFNSFDEMSAALAKVILEWRANDTFFALRGWRDERLHVWANFADPPLLEMERSATCLFGVKQYGAHINGYLQHPEKGLCLWIGTRSKNKKTWPGKLDQMAAGALSAEDDILGCAKREAKEEASVPDNILENLKSVGCVSYLYEDERGLFPETQFVYDLEVPEDFTPVNADGEVASFQLMDVPQIKTAIAEDKFKFNCALVMVDFFMRHGIIKPDEEPNYSYIAAGMHRDL